MRWDNNVIQTVSQAAGMIPFIGSITDWLNAVIDSADEDYTEIIFSAAALVPGIGDSTLLAAKLAKERKGRKGLSKLDTSGFLTKGIEMKRANVLDTIKGVVKEGASLLHYDRNKMLKTAKGRMKEHVLIENHPKKDKLEYIENGNFDTAQSSGDINHGIPMIGVAIAVPTIKLIFELALSAAIVNETDKVLSGKRSKEITKLEKERIERESRKKATKATNEIMRLKDPNLKEYERILNKNGIPTNKMSDYEITVRAKIISDLQGNSVSKKVEGKGKTGKQKSKDKNNLPEQAGRGQSKGGRHTPETLQEELAMEEVMKSPQKGRELKGKNTDPRWPAKDGWEKWTQNVNGHEIHYQYNPRTGLIDDVKFK